MVSFAKVLKACGLPVLGLGVALVGAEFYLQVRGYGVALNSFADFPLQMHMHTDKARGWCNRFGLVTDELNGDVNAVIWEKAGRLSRPMVFSPRRQPKLKILQVGCSFSYGKGIRDDETLAWQFNMAHPEWQMDNCGVNGYGAYQSFKTAEITLENSSDDYQLLIYEGIAGHLRRDAGDRYFFGEDEHGNCLTAAYPKLGENLSQGRVLSPYHWWGDSWWRLMEFAKRAYCARIDEHTLSWQHFLEECTPDELLAMDKSLIAMKECATAHGLKFLYFQTDDWPPALSAHLDELCRDNGIDTLRLTLPRIELAPRERRDYDGLEIYHSRYQTIDGFHPNKEANREYAEAIAGWIRKNFDKIN